MMEKSLKASAELKNIIESVETFSPTLYVALFDYNDIIEYEKNADERRHPPEN